MSKWKEETRNGEVVGSEIRFGIFKLSIHHYFGCGEQWFASCSYVFDRMPLASDKLLEAKGQAIAMLQTKLQKAIDEIAKA